MWLSPNTVSLSQSIHPTVSPATAHSNKYLLPSFPPSLPNPSSSCSSSHFCMCNPIDYLMLCYTLTISVSPPLSPSLSLPPPPLLSPSLFLSLSPLLYLFLLHHLLVQTPVLRNSLVYEGVFHTHTIKGKRKSCLFVFAFNFLASVM